MPETHGAVNLGPKPQQQPEPEVEEDPNEAIRRQLPPQVRPVWDELTMLRDENGELMQELAKHGVGLDPISVLTTKLSAIADTLWDGNTVKGQTKMIQMEIRYEKMMAGVLTEATKNIVKAMLTQGSNMPPAFIKQMERQSKMIHDSRNGG